MEDEMNSPDGGSSPSATQTLTRQEQEEPGSIKRNGAAAPTYPSFLLC